MDKEMTLLDIVTDEKDKKILQPVEPAKRKKPFTKGRVAVSKLRMKKEPEDYTEVLCMLSLHDIVIINDTYENDEYYKVTYKGIVGYVPKKSIIIT